MGADPSPEPVFVDRTGARHRWWTTFGVLSAAVLSLVAAGILAGLLGGAGGVLPHLPVAAPDAGGPAPGTVTGGGAVQRMAADGTVTTRALPAKTIALTFDDGPDPEWTPKVLDVLARYRARATFFEIGSQVDQHPELS